MTIRRRLCEALETYLDGVVAQKTAELGEPIMRMLEVAGHAAHHRSQVDGASRRRWTT